MNSMKLAENAAGIAACVFEHAGFRQAYERSADRVGGSIGLWRVCAEVGEKFTEAEAEFGEQIWDRRDWPNAIESIATLIVLVLARHGTHEQTDWRSASRFVIANGIRVSVNSETPSRVQIDFTL